MLQIGVVTAVVDWREEHFEAAICCYCWVAAARRISATDGVVGSSAVAAGPVIAAERRHSIFVAAKSSAGPHRRLVPR